MLSIVWICLLRSSIVINFVTGSKTLSSVAHKSYLRIRICISANATVAATATGFNLTSIDRQTHIDLISTWADIFHNRAKEDWDRFKSFPPAQRWNCAGCQLWTNLDFTEIQTGSKLHWASISNSGTKLLQDFKFGPKVLIAQTSLTIITKKWSRLKYISKLLADFC